MALSDFFRINLPYGIERNDKGEWTAFNREYEPLGANTKKEDREFIYTKYVNVTEKLLHKVAEGNSFNCNDKKELIRIWLYNDDTNPASNPEHWKDYMKKLKLLSQFEI
jgi:hypothetical protein